MLEDIYDGIQYHPRVNRREARYKIRNCIKRRRSERNGALKDKRKFGKGLYKAFKTVVK